MSTFLNLHFLTYQDKPVYHFIFLYTGLNITVVICCFRDIKVLYFTIIHYYIIFIIIKLHM